MFKKTLPVALVCVPRRPRNGDWRQQHATERARFVMLACCTSLIMSPFVLVKNVPLD
jgi:hypothetical protein